MVHSIIQSTNRFSLGSYAVTASQMDIFSMNMFFLENDLTAVSTPVLVHMLQDRTSVGFFAR